MSTISGDILGALDDGATSVEQIAAATGLEAGVVRTNLYALKQRDKVKRDFNKWERTTDADKPQQGAARSRTPSFVAAPIDWSRNPLVAETRAKAQALPTLNVESETSALLAKCGVAVNPEDVARIDGRLAARRRTGRFSKNDAAELLANVPGAASPSNDAMPSSRSPYRGGPNGRESAPDDPASPDEGNGVTDHTAQRLTKARRDTPASVAPGPEAAESAPPPVEVVADRFDLEPSNLGAHSPVAVPERVLNGHQTGTAELIPFTIFGDHVVLRRDDLAELVGTVERLLGTLERWRPILVAIA